MRAAAVLKSYDRDFNYDYAGMYVTCICCGLSVKRENRTGCNTSGQRSLAHFIAFVSMHVVDKDPDTPNWSSMTNNATTRGSIGLTMNRGQNKQGPPGIQKMSGLILSGSDLLFNIFYISGIEMDQHF